MEPVLGTASFVLLALQVRPLASPRLLAQSLVVTQLREAASSLIQGVAVAPSQVHSLTMPCCSVVPFHRLPCILSLSHILSAQFARAQMTNIGAKPYTETVISRRADRLANKYPQSVCPVLVLPAGCHAGVIKSRLRAVGARGRCFVAHEPPVPCRSALRKYDRKIVRDFAKTTGL